MENTKWIPFFYRSAEFVEEKRDPLTIKPKTNSASAEDRAKLIKSKKLGSLMKINDNEVTVLKCGKCTAFFIDQNDYEKHKKSHNENGIDDNNSQHIRSDSPLAQKSCRRKSMSYGSRTSQWYNSESGRQKLRIKIGGNIVVKKTAPKISESRNNCEDDSSEFESPSTVRRSSRFQSRNDEVFCSSDVESGETIMKKSRKLNSSEEKTDAMEDLSLKKKKSKSSNQEITTVIVSEIDEEGNETGCFDIEMKSKETEKVENKSKIYTEELQAVRKVVKKLKEQKLKSPFTPNSELVSKKRKSRLKRLRYSLLGEDDKNEIIYTCAHCQRNFRRKSNLKRHMSKLHCGKETDEAGDSSKWFTGYCCDICGEGLQQRTTMMAHRDVIHNSVPEIEWCKYLTSLARVKFCGNCTKYFRAGKLFDEHECDRDRGVLGEKKIKLIKEAEEIPPTYACHECNQCFRWKWDYRWHHENDHKDLPAIDWSTIMSVKLDFCCLKCFKAFNSEEELKCHQCSATPQQHSADMVVKPFRCDICGNDYFWKSDFRRHMRTKHPKENYKPTEHDTIIYSCPYCEEKFSMKKRVLYHMRKVHSITSDSPFVCVKCNKVFRRRDNLDRHNESYHPALTDEKEANHILQTAEIRINGEIAYHCQTCNRNISNPNRFISHYRGHYSESKFTCDLCGKQAKTQHQLNTHIKNIHLNIRNYICDICNKSFYTKQACEEHRRIHTGERPFSCEICGKTFVAGNALISHKRFHNDFYPHSCHMCPKKFKVRRSLINHIRTHTGERPFKCDLCTKTFNNSSQYSYHKKVTHSEARPFCCSTCGNCFKANKFLSRHMELHAVRSQIQSRKPNNPANYVTAQIKSDTNSSTTNTVAAVSVAMPLTQVSAAPVEAAQSTMSIVPNYVTKEMTTAYRSDDLAVTLYSLQRGYEPNGSEFGRQVECEMKMQRPFTAAEAYMAAANYALAPNDEYNKPNTVRTYNVNPTPTGNMVTGKHLTWL